MKNVVRLIVVFFISCLSYTSAHARSRTEISIEVYPSADNCVDTFFITYPSRISLKKALALGLGSASGQLTGECDITPGKTLEDYTLRKVDNTAPFEKDIEGITVKISLKLVDGHVIAIGDISETENVHSKIKDFIKKIVSNIGPMKLVASPKNS